MNTLNNLAKSVFAHFSEKFFFLYSLNFITDFVAWIVTFYQLMLVVTGVMHEADNAYSIRSTCCDFMNTLRNFAKSVFAQISANFKYFAKQFILTESPDHVL